MSNPNNPDGAEIAFALGILLVLDALLTLAFLGVARFGFGLVTPNLPLAIVSAVALLTLLRIEIKALG